MKRTHKKAKRSNFLLAAEMVFIGHTKGYEDIEVDGHTIVCSKWCCNSLGNIWRTGNPGNPTAVELQMFKDYFFPGYDMVDSNNGGGWWNRIDCESRVLALLLCAEMLRR